MSCCSPEPDEDAPSVRHLIHDMSSYWIDQDKPVYVDCHDASGELRLFMVTGITSTARGQSFDLRPVENPGT